MINDLTAEMPALLPRLHATYRDLHAHPELAGQERRTSRIVATWLRETGWKVSEGIGGYGVVGVLSNGAGPTVLLRADMDALPVLETTGLPYASTVTALNSSGIEVPVMHACGHDIHVTCLLGAATALAARQASWTGTVVAVFQPAEETGTGAQAMIDDGLLERFPKPDICLGQHVSPLPVGVVVTKPGPVLAAADSLTITLPGRGGHSSDPRQVVDPAVLAAMTILRLNTVVSREVSPGEFAVLAVGSVTVGGGPNIVADRAELTVNIRTGQPNVQARLLRAIERIVRAEATASGADRAPTITRTNGFPLTINDPAATERVIAALTSERFHVHRLPEILAASEDFGRIGTAARCPSVFWHLGGDSSYSQQELMALPELGLPQRIAGPHSGGFAPAPEPTITNGVRALLVTARAWLPGPRPGTG